VSSSTDTLIRLVAQGVVDGSTYALLGISFGYILFVTGRLHFAYAFSYSLAAYVLARLSEVVGLPLWTCVVFGVCAAVVSGVLCEVVVYRPLVERSPNRSLVPVFVAALGLSIAGSNFISLIWDSTSDSKAVSKYTAHVYHFGPVALADVQIAVVILAIVVVILGTLFMTRTRIGRLIRAVTVDAELARTIGMNLERTFIVVFALGSTIAGVLACFTAMHLSATADMGTTPVFYGFLVAFLGGHGSSLLRLALSGLAVGLLADVTQYWLSPGYSQVLIFGLLSLYVAVQPFKGTETLRSRIRRSRRPDVVTAQSPAAVNPVVTSGAGGDL
jgi:branched-chain amino acid transport system permease protein